MPHDRPDGDESVVTAATSFGEVSGRPKALHVRRFRQVVLFGSAAAAVVALAGLGGYLPGLGLLGSIRVDFVPMAPSTGISFLVLVAILVRQARAPLSEWSARLACAVVLLISLFGLLVVIGTALGTTLTLEDRLFPDKFTVNGIPIGRMSAMTGATFLAAGLGILAWLLGAGGTRHARRLGDVASILGIVTVLAGGTNLLSYLYGQPLLYGGTAVPMAVTTALAFVFLGGAVIAAAGPQARPMRLFVGDSTNALLSRALVPLVAVLVLFQGVVVAWVKSGDTLAVATQIVTVGVVTTLVVAAVVRTMGRRLDEADRGVRESEERFRALVESANDAIFMWDAERLRCLEANRAACERLVYTRAELLTMTVAQISAPEQAAITAARAAVIAQRDSGFVETVHMARDGTRIPTEVSTTVVHLGGRPVFLSIARDIRGRKRAEEALRNSEAALRDAQRVAHIGSWAWHVKDNRLEWSPEMYRIFGIDEATFSGALDEVVSRAIHPDDRAAVEASNRSVAEDGRPVPLEYRVVHPDGSVRVVWAEAGALPLDDAGNPEVLTGIVQDITERKQAEAEKAALEAQLQQAQKMESVGRLAGGVAHDFNNMLGAILGNAGLALEELDPASPAKPNLIEIQEAALRAADLTRQLLAFARRQTVAPRVLDLDEAVGGMLNMLRRLTSAGVELAWRPGGDPWPVRVDPSQLDQVLANLVVNAGDAVGDTGTVTIETGNATLDADACATRPGAVPGDYVALTVGDDGVGMDAETMSHIFEPFFTTKESGKGTGLGLATVYGIVKQNGGYIDVASEPGAGSTFRVLLPRHVGPATAPEAPAQGVAAGDGETILLVEDEPAILRLATVMLERLGYDVVAAATPGEAIRLAREHQGEIHLLMTDVVMPEMNGRDLAGNLLTLYPRLGLLYMSGYTADVIADHGVLDEGVHFLHKPFSAGTLAASVREALDHDPVSPDPPAG